MKTQKYRIKSRESAQNLIVKPNKWENFGDNCDQSEFFTDFGGLLPPLKGMVGFTKRGVVLSSEKDVRQFVDNLTNAYEIHEFKVVKA